MPSSLDIELKYRRPIAAVESSDPIGVMFLPIDDHAVRLPEGDLTETERRYLPRVSGITGPAARRRRLGRSARHRRREARRSTLRRLAATAACRNPRQRTNTAHKEKPALHFEIVTTGGTRIIWGATPAQESTIGESPFIQKRQRLLDYATQHGKLESIDGPAVLDVRSDVVVTPRTARKNAAAAAKKKPRKRSNRGRLRVKLRRSCNPARSARACSGCPKRSPLGALHLLGQFFADDRQLGAALPRPCGHRRGQF